MHENRDSLTNVNVVNVLGESSSVIKPQKNEHDGTTVNITKSILKIIERPRRNMLVIIVGLRPES